jgi:hypothetical protein
MENRIIDENNLNIDRDTFKRVHKRIVEKYIDDEIASKEQNIISTFGDLFPYTRYRGDKSIEQISAKKLAELQSTGNAFELKNYENIKFDLFFCAGGVNDQIRNKYLGNLFKYLLVGDYFYGC